MCWTLGVTTQSAVPSPTSHTDIRAHPGHGNEEAHDKVGKKKWEPSQQVTTPKLGLSPKTTNLDRLSDRHDLQAHRCDSPSFHPLFLACQLPIAPRLELFAARITADPNFPMLSLIARERISVSPVRWYDPFHTEATRLPGQPAFSSLHGFCCPFRII